MSDLPDPTDRLPPLPKPDPALGAAIEAAAVSVMAPGQGPRRVLSPGQVAELAARFSLPRWEVEAAGLDRQIVPLRGLRLLPRLAPAEQAALLRSRAALVGGGPALAKAVELLALTGVGRLTLLLPADWDDPDEGERLVAFAQRQNASLEARTGRIELRPGNVRADPAAALRGHDVCAAVLEAMQEEMLLQMACRRLEIPVILAGMEYGRGQITAVLPGDPGIGLVYRPTHPHLEKERPASLLGGGKAALMVGSWIEQQVVAALLRRDDLLRGRLLFADMAADLIETYSLTGR